MATWSTSQSRKIPTEEVLKEINKKYGPIDANGVTAATTGLMGGSLTCDAGVCTVVSAKGNFIIWRSDKQAEMEAAWKAATEGPEESGEDLVPTYTGSLDLLMQKNALLDLVESRGSQIVVTGDTSVGKSTTINFMLGFPINFEAAGIGTRRPCVLSQVYEKGRTKVLFTVRFVKGGENLERSFEDNFEAVKDLIAKANSPKENRHFFDCLKGKSNASEDDYDMAFDDTPITIQMRHQDFVQGLRLVDLPGLTSRCPGPMEIAKKYLTPDNIAVLVLATDKPENSQWFKLAREMAVCKEVMFVQNFATDAIEKEVYLHNYNEAKRELTKTEKELVESGEKKKENLFSHKLRFQLADFGVGWSKDREDKGKWKSGIDQADWMQWKKNPTQVRQEMWKHAKKRGDMIKQKSGAELKEHGSNFEVGLYQIIQKILDYSATNIEAEVANLVDMVNQEIEAMDEKLGNEQARLKQLEDSPLWQEVIGEVSKTCAQFLDTTIELEFPDSLMTSADEVSSFRDMVKRGLTSEGLEKGEEDPLQWRCTCAQCNARFAAGGKCIQADARTKRLLLEIDEHLKDPNEKWFCPSGYTDSGGITEIENEIMSTLKQDVGFEGENKLSCLRSWHRLLDEFTGVIAFCPMPCMTHKRVSLGANKITQNAGGDRDYVDTMVEQVIQSKLYKEEGLPSTPMMMVLFLKHFQERFAYLATRDITNACTLIAKDMTGKIKDTIELARTAEGEDVKSDDLVKKIVKNCQTVIIRHMRTTIEDYISGVLATATEYVEKSGLCVVPLDPERSNTPKEHLHWQLPFRKHYFNGQIPWMYLDDPTPKPIEEFRPPNQESSFKTVETSTCINMANHVNGLIYDCCTKYTPSRLEENPTLAAYNVEVLKLLKAMQGEVACFWESSRLKLLQDIKNMNAVQNFIVAEKRKSKEKFLANMGEKELTQAVAQVLAYCENTTQQMQCVSGKDSMMSEQEVAAVGKNACWPKIDQTTYFGILKQLAKDFKERTGRGFGGSYPDPEASLAYEPAYIRLCNEFTFVMLRLPMRSVTEPEVGMAKASAGSVTLAGEQEIISKLVMHRLRELGQDYGEVFAGRFDSIYNRDITRAVTNTLQGTSDEIKTWMTDKLREFMQREITSSLRALTKKFEELQPFEFSTLNGRLPMTLPMEDRETFKGWQDLVNGKVHLQTCILDDGFKKFACAEDAAAMESQVAEFTAKPVCEMKTKEPANPGEVQERLELADDLNNKAYDLLTSNDFTRKLIDEALQAHSSGKGEPVKANPENNKNLAEMNYAGKQFHDCALRVHKAMSAHAIDYCRPRLKAMMANIYQEDSLRGVLNANEETRWLYTLNSTLKDITGGDALDGVKREIQRLATERDNKKNILDQVLNKVATSSEIKVDPTARADMAEAELKELKDKYDAECAQRIEEAKESAKSTQDLATLKKNFEVIDAERKRMVAIRDLSCGFHFTVNELKIVGLKLGEGDQVFCVGYVFTKNGFNGKSVKEIQAQRIKDIQAQQFAFETKRKEAESCMCWDASDIQDNETKGAIIQCGSFQLPDNCMPVTEYFLAVAVFSDTLIKKESLFHGRKVCQEPLFTCLLPLAYVLRSKPQWKDIDPNEFSVPEPAQLKPDKAFAMDDAEQPDPSSLEAKEMWRFQFRESDDQFEEVELNEDKGKYRGAEFTISMSASPKESYWRAQRARN